VSTLRLQIGNRYIAAVRQEIEQEKEASNVFQRIILLYLEWKLKVGGEFMCISSIASTGI